MQHHLATEVTGQKHMYNTQRLKDHSLEVFLAADNSRSS